MTSGEIEEPSAAGFIAADSAGTVTAARIASAATLQKIARVIVVSLPFAIARRYGRGVLWHRSRYSVGAGSPQSKASMSPAMQTLRRDRLRTAMRFVMAAFYGCRHRPSHRAGLRSCRSCRIRAVAARDDPGHRRCARLAGAAALLTRLRRLAGIMLALYALCVWPANIKHAVEHIPLPPSRTPGGITRRGWRFSRC